MAEPRLNTYEGRAGLGPDAEVGKVRKLNGQAATRVAPAHGDAARPVVQEYQGIAVKGVGVQRKCAAATQDAQPFSREETALEKNSVDGLVPVELQAVVADTVALLPGAGKCRPRRRAAPHRGTTTRWSGRARPG